MEIGEGANVIQNANCYKQGTCETAWLSIERDKVVVVLLVVVVV